MRISLSRMAVGVVLGMCVWAAQASAEPANGFGAALGVAAHYYAERPSYASAGGSVGGDMQFVVNDAWSLNPYLMLSGEALFDGKTGSAMNGVAGFEVRRWSGNNFLGGHLGAYTAYIVEKGSSRNLYLPGVGITVGTERPDGWGVALVVDLPRSLSLVAESPLIKGNIVESGVRLHITYRFR